MSTAIVSTEQQQQQTNVYISSSNSTNNNKNDSSPYYETVDLLDLDFDEKEEVFSKDCPCGDKFYISVQELLENENIGNCPSCSLIIKVNYDTTNVRERFAPS